jgi:hypothetical protein
MEGTNKRSVIFGPRERPNLAAIDRSRKFAPNIISSTEIQTKCLEKRLHDCKGVLSTRGRDRYHMEIRIGTDDLQLTASDHIYNQQCEVMAAQRNEDPGFLKNAPHFSGDLIHHVAPSVGTRIAH